MAVLQAYEWLVVVGAFGAFAFGYGTGANDVANAFATSVGAKTLSLRQATLIAAIFEFGGALLLGRVVTKTISGGIADVATFQREPEFYAYGMCVALGVSAIWQIVASYWGLNVSSTHSIIGSIIGFSLVYAGKDAVVWADKDTTGATFPPYKGVLPIILSWFVSPILTGGASAIIFFICRLLVLRRKDSWKMTLYLLPVAVLITTWINVYFVFTKGAKKSLDKNGNWSDSKSAWISAVVAAGTALLTAIIGIPLLRRRAEAFFAAAEEADKNAVEMADVKPQLNLEEPAPVDAAPAWRRMLDAGKKAALHGVDYDIHAVVKTDDDLSRMHANAEAFDPKTEYAFSYLQVFSAICVIFAHGAGEVGYMAGPLAVIYEIYETGTVTKELEPKVWIVLIGAIGLVFGLATYGYKVTQAMGTMLSKLSPSRGFAAELATALIITLAAQYGLPTSSSQCITGGIIGVGILEGLGGVNWKNFLKQFLSWVATLFVIGIFVAALYSQGVYSPSKIMGDQIRRYEDTLTNTTRTITGNLNTTLYQFRNASAAGAVPTLTPAQWAALNSTIAGISKNAADLTNVKTYQSITPDMVFTYLNRALRLLENQTVLALGQTSIVPGANVCNNNVTADILSGIRAVCPAARVVPRGAIL